MRKPFYYLNARSHGSATYDGIKVARRPGAAELIEIEAEYVAFRDSIMGPWFASKGVVYAGDMDVAMVQVQEIFPDAFEWNQGAGQPWGGANVTLDDTSDIEASEEDLE